MLGCNVFAFLHIIKCLVSENQFREFLPDSCLSFQRCSCLTDTYRESRLIDSRAQSNILHLDSLGSSFSNRLESQMHSVRGRFFSLLLSSAPLRGGGSVLNSGEEPLQANEANNVLHDEVAALEAIYGADIHVSSHTDDPSQAASTGFGVMIGPSLRMRLLCPATYPRDPPIVVLDAAVNASSPAAPPPAHLASSSASLRAHLTPLQEGMRGSPMILDLVASAQEWAADEAAAKAAAAAAGKSRRTPPSEAPMTAGGGSEGGAEDADAAEGRLLGTPVTPAAFAQLRARMLQELPPPLSAAERASPLTGREIWQRRAQDGGAAEAGDGGEDGAAGAEAGSGAEGSDAGPGSEESAAGTDSDE
jgi:hypothetical protein